ncbi:MAG: sulfatase-like hydrolase/transferase, partial [Planctomycetaceae bacterium]|nr:sulfatase-like hydrolase/transferase [Planctomycetaceae bacterium]
RGRFGPDVFREAGIDFIQRNAAKPFLLYVPLTLTHGRTFADPTVHTPLNMRTDRPEKEMFGDMVRYADRIVGEFVDELQRLKIDEKTIVLVATDNGTESRIVGRRNGREVRGGLYQMTEAGGNVGLVAYCPKMIAGGRTVALADFTDILPTVCDFAGVELPKDLKIDGVSQAKILRGGHGATAPRSWILNQYNTRRVVRDERYKLYSTGEFFDANHDPEELADLSGTSDQEQLMVKRKLQGILDSLPADTPPPFKLRSQSAFKLEALKRAEQGGS